MSGLKPSLARDILAILHDMTPEEAKEEARTYVGHRQVAHELTDAGCPVDEVMALVDEITRLQSDTPLEIIRMAAAGKFPPVQSRKVTKVLEARSPRWPSGIPEIDGMCGGYYAFTVVGGESGVGKSIQATASSLYAAAEEEPWKVIYANGELGPDEICRRATAFWGGDHPSLNKQWKFIDFLQGISFDRLAFEICERVSPADDKVLIVIDSVNSYVRKCGAHGNGYFAEIDRMAGFAETCVRMSRGKVGMLMVSELTRGGDIKGGTTEYVCSLDVRLTSDDANVTKIVSAKGREGGGRQDYGSYYPNPWTCKFEKLAEITNEETGKTVAENPPPFYERGDNGGMF